ncbi:dTDP-4-dehydrorhamnose reductase [Alkaliphilus sp. MSJ-5]|uniref:dTDP-4-dehydrorhamnose reductase n=1 Tax=Alkaliphilus flagellatus TaxID=2841507 RepID=A0ABS6G9A4_9FIRM|nr:dTDP-4-dehydrorhamnose reductase [Alkaliphilus flagellatus]MBU5677956.1 dTDP-4-dehydrorhamnose reductase [Alkaliphilus flagellatus]
MKICILGGSGQLGYELSKDLEKLDFDIVSLRRKDLDITNLDSCYEILNSIRPEFVIHAAAYTDIDGCEKTPDLAYSVNTNGTENITKAVEKIGTKLIYVSTDHVFDGVKGSSYNEYDTPNPINVYGMSKYNGELIVKKNLEKYFIVRTSSIFGHRSKNLIKAITNLTNTNTILNIISDQKRSPTYSADFSTALIQLLNNEDYGIYHLVNKGSCSWYEFVQYIFKIKEMEVKVVPINSKDLQLMAKRPENISLNNSSYIRLRSWEEAVEEYLTFT